MSGYFGRLDRPFISNPVVSIFGYARTIFGWVGTAMKRFAA